MALTKDFKKTIIARAERDAKFRQAMLVEAVNELLEGNINVAKAMLRDYVNATMSFSLLSKKLHKDSKSVQRMLGPKGNPTTQSLIELLHILQKNEGIHLRVKVKNRG